MPTEVRRSTPYRRRVLIVDDAPDVRQDLRLLLQLRGEREIVGEAANGQEAIRQAEALRPAVVLLDLEMPVMDGFAAAREIKSRLPSCRVIALTVHDDPAAREKAGEASVDAFLVKGGSIRALLGAIAGPGDGGDGPVSKALPPQRVGTGDV